MDCAPAGARDDLNVTWANGYSIAELWGYTKPVSRPEPASVQTHVLLWGILSIVEYQVDQGAGHSYLRERLWNRDWDRGHDLQARIGRLGSFENPLQRSPTFK